MNNKGFTLVEILAVIVILAILMTIASSSVSGVIQKSRKNTAIEMQEALKESALTYVMGKYYLSKCDKNYEVNSSNYSSSSTNKCVKAITAETLKNEGLFEDKKEYCSNDTTVYVYHYYDGTNSEYKAYIDSEACLD